MIWRITAAVALPRLIGGEMPAGGGMPGQLHRIPRISGCQSTTVEGSVVSLRAFEDPQFPENPVEELEWAEFFCNVEADTAIEAVAHGADLIGVVLDDLSFRMDMLLTISQIEAINVTRPVRVGDQREVIRYPYPTGYPSWRLSRSTALGHVASEQVVVLRPSYAEVTGRERRAVDWYLKAVSTPVEVDQFMFLWISLEVLLDSDEESMIEAPLRGRCQHDIAKCPVCGKPTTAPVRGLSVRGYLQRHGASEEEAAALWQTRMMMHGKADLIEGGTPELSAHVQVLRACVVGALKDRLGMEPAEAPVVTAGTMTIRPEMALGGLRGVEAGHLADC